MGGGGVSILSGLVNANGLTVSDLGITTATDVGCGLFSGFGRGGGGGIRTGDVGGAAVFESSVDCSGGNFSRTGWPGLDSAGPGSGRFDFVMALSEPGSGFGTGGTTLVVAGLGAFLGVGGNGGGRRSDGVGVSIGVFRSPSTRAVNRPGWLRVLSISGPMVIGARGVDLALLKRLKP